MNYTQEFELLGRALWSGVLGGIIGWEREHAGHPAGIRTFAMVTVGSCVFGLVSRFAPGAVDPTRIAAQVVAGIGFLCAGLILRVEGQVRGLTTAATLWVSAAIGLAIAFQMGLLGTLTTLVLVALLRVQHAGFYEYLVPNRRSRQTRVNRREAGLSGRRQGDRDRETPDDELSHPD
ncbi:MAG: MgtC/SapB family protein [Candidatus Sumerlaeaceae bacterium]